MVVTETDGSKVYSFTVSYTPDEPIKGPDFDQAVTAIITSVSIDNDTGLPVQKYSNLWLWKMAPSVPSTGV